jgi:hypothetical protein
VEVVTVDFPTCWEMDVMDNGSAEDGEDENEDVYTRYVDVAVLLSDGGPNFHRDI